MKKSKKKSYVSAEPFFKEAMKDPEIRFLYQKEMEKMMSGKKLPGMKLTYLVKPNLKETKKIEGAVKKR